MRVIAAAGARYSVVTFIPEGNICLRYEWKSGYYFHHFLKEKRVVFLKKCNKGASLDPIEGLCNVLFVKDFDFNPSDYTTVTRMMKAFQAKVEKYAEAWQAENCDQSGSGSGNLPQT